MSTEKQRSIARLGGQAISQNRSHMAEIGRKGGEASGFKRRQNALRKKGIAQAEV